MTGDPYAAWRPHDGKQVTVRLTEFLEDVDGLPVGVDVEESTGLLVLPSLPDPEEDSP